MASSVHPDIADRPTAGEVKLDAVRALVGAAQRSERMQAAAAVALKGVAAGLAAMALAEVLALAGIAGPAQGEFWPRLAIWGAAGFGAGVLGFGTQAALLAPSGVEMARRIDVRLGLKNRLGTALEVAGQNEGDVLLRRALFGDAEKVAQGIMPAAARTRRDWRWAWVLPVLLAVVITLGLVLQGRDVPMPAVMTAPVAVTAEELAETETVLTQIVEMIRREPAAATPMLEALARTVEAVRDDLANAAPERATLTQTLAEIAAQAAQAADGSALGGRIEAALGEQAAALERGPQADPATPAPPQGDLPASEARPQAPDTPKPSAPLPTTGAAQTSLQGDQKPPQGTQYYSPDPHALSRQIAERAQAQMNGGAPAGGARDADRGGNQAGDGVRPLVASMDELAAASAAALETMILPQNDASAGQRVRINTMPPQAGPGSAMDGSAPTAGWSAAATSPFNRPAPVGEVEVLKRYFPQSGGEF